MPAEIVHPIRTAADIVGGMTELARRAGVSRFTLYKAIEAGLTTSPDLAVAIDDATDGAVTREVLCPRVFAQPRRRARRSIDTATADAA